MNKMTKCTFKPLYHYESGEELTPWCEQFKEMADEYEIIGHEVRHRERGYVYSRYDGEMCSKIREGQRLKDTYGNEKPCADGSYCRVLEHVR